MFSWIPNLSLPNTYWWLGFAEAAVLVGVFIEVIPPFFKFAREAFWRNGWRSAVCKSLHHWDELIVVFGGIVVVLGILYENSLSASAQTKEGEARNRSDRTIALLQIAAAPRNLHPPTTFALEAAIIAKGQIGIVVRSYAFDAEGGRLADAIITQLKIIGFAVADQSLTSGGERPLAFGVFVSGPDKDLVAAVLGWLNESRLEAVRKNPPPSVMSFGGESFSTGIPSCVIFVGAKPLPSDTP